MLVGCSTSTTHFACTAFAGLYDTTVLVPLIVSTLIPAFPARAFLKLSKSPKKFSRKNLLIDLNKLSLLLDLCIPLLIDV